MNIPEGYAHIEGRSGKRAKRLLELAIELGYQPPEDYVRTTSFGYTLPVEVAQAYDEDGITVGLPVTEPVTVVATPADGETGEPAVVTNADGSSPELDENGVPIMRKSQEELDAEAAAAAAGAGETGTETTEADAAGADAKTEGEPQPEPPRAGAGSSTKAWSDWAAAVHGYDPAESLTRDELIAKYGAKATE